MATTVHISSGAIAGTQTDAGVRIYRGIPFAAPPVGPLRWQPPQPVVPWTGVHDGARFGYDPVQIDDPARSLAPGMSEDCLTLNVWAPADVPASGAPVMVWIFGGNFVTGSGARINAEGERLARRGVVLVAINYRIGVLGFFAHPALTAESPQQASGNYGFLDQIAALRWIRENVAAFGGDPARITIFGESAGGASVALLLTSPLARGLFDRVILQSPGALRRLLPLADAERAGLALGEDIAALRALPATELVSKNVAFMPPQRGIMVPRPLRVIVDGWSIDRDEIDAFRSGAFAAVPTIVGSNANEGGWFTANVPVTTPGRLRDYVRRHFGATFDEAWTHYGAVDDAGVQRAVADVIGDVQFSYAAQGIAQEMARREPHTYRYLFTHAGAFTSDPPVHTDEIVYVFGNGDFGPRDRIISDAIMSAWTNFAATGDPNGAGAPHWPAYDPARDNYLTLAVGFAEGERWRAASLAYIDRLYGPRPASPK